MASRKTATKPVVETLAPEVENPVQETQVDETEKVETTVVETEQVETLAPEVENPVQETQVDETETASEEGEKVEAEKEETTQIEQEEKPAPKVPAPQRAAAPKVTEKAVDIAELPDYAKRVLKLYDNEPYLYVTAKGGAFRPDSKPSERGGAILYKNPFYKS